ncbi:MAG: substrate-binding domain-containing protein, partial [Actinobacteria bacterium]|nr:substrate-binding domain-containing protein [Actinomycetota bacterium]
CEAADEFSVDAGRAATRRLLCRTEPDGLLCANDLLAAGAIGALRAAGYEIPDHIAVVGMDNSELAGITWPPLSSVDLGSEERARRAVELLMDRIEQPARPTERIHVEARLVVRASSSAEVLA